VHGCPVDVEREYVGLCVRQLGNELLDKRLFLLVALLFEFELLLVLLEHCGCGGLGAAV